MRTSTDLSQNPGPGAKFCPLCLKDSFTRRIRNAGSATDMHSYATCGHCGQETDAKLWMDWNAAKEAAGAATA